MDKHETYSVMLTDDKGRRGTGTLFYTKNATKFYILTCAHVVDDAESITIRILVPTDTGQPVEYQTTAAKTQVHYSPLDNVIKINELESQHSCDIAVIECDIGNIPLSPTYYAVYPMTKKERILALGYPITMMQHPLYYQQDCLHGQVERVLDNQNYFIVRILDSYLNASDRESEIKGFSGSPVWDEEQIESDVYLLGGLISFGEGANISRARVSVMNAKLIQSLMRDEFGIHLETRIPSVPSDDIAPGYEMDRKDEADSKIVRDSWIENERRKAQTYIDMLQLQKGMDVCRCAINNTEFEKCTMEQKYALYAVLIEAYRLARDYDGYDRIIEEMHTAGIHNEREYLITAVRYFEGLDNKTAALYVQKALDVNPNGNEERVFQIVIDAMNNDAADVSILSTVLGSRDQLLVKPKNDQEEAGIYQILGYVLGHRFKETGRAIRCLNRAYQISGNYIILETLATLYYFHSIREARLMPDSDKIDPLKIDQGEIDKARDAYLRVLSAADELYLKGLIKRTGLPMFKCFYFIRDNFRIYKHYHDLIKYFDFPDRETLRDVQLCYLDVAIQKGPVNLYEYNALTEHDRRFYELILKLHMPMIQVPSVLEMPVEISEGDLLKLLRDAEDEIQALIESQPDDRLSFEGIHTTMINIYGNGIRRYHWKVLPEIRRHFAQLKNPVNIEFLQLYIDELEIDNYELSEKKYQQLFESRQDVLSFNEWCHFYTRHDKIEKTKELYDSVFTERSFLIENQSEYFYRAYILFYIEHRLDLTAAIRCFVEHKHEIKDIFLRLMFEMELNFAAVTFNDPDLMLETAKELADEGILGERDYREKCLIINMLNCRKNEAARYVDASPEASPFQMTTYERMFFVWKGYPVFPNPHWISMQHWSKMQLDELYTKETWLKPVAKIMEDFHMNQRKMIVVDLWAVYYLEKIRQSQILNYFDQIYITHNTVSMALQEINNVNDDDIRSALKNIQNAFNVILKSPTLDEQLDIRNPNDPYMEIHSALLLAERLDCPIFAGEFRFAIQERFHDRIIRPNSWIEICRFYQ